MKKDFSEDQSKSVRTSGITSNTVTNYAHELPSLLQSFSKDASSKNSDVGSIIKASGNLEDGTFNLIMKGMIKVDDQMDQEDDNTKFIKKFNRGFKKIEDLQLVK